jgi:DNA-binding CsgD family transcriptional regulator
VTRLGEDSPAPLPASAGDLTRDVQDFTDVGALTFVLDQMPVGVVLVVESGAVIWMNRSAERLVRIGDGVALCRGRLVASSRLEATDFEQMVTRASGAPSTSSSPGNAETIRLFRSSSSTSLVAVVRAVVQTDRRAEARAVVFLLDPDHHLRVSRERLRRLYKLTPTESDLVALLAAGHSLHAAAAQLAVTQQSARTYLKRAFEKTGTRRQAELVRLALAVATAGADDA